MLAEMFCVLWVMRIGPYQKSQKMCGRCSGMRTGQWKTHRQNVRAAVAARKRCSQNVLPVLEDFHLHRSRLVTETHFRTWLEETSQTIWLRLMRKSLAKGNICLQCSDIAHWFTLSILPLQNINIVAFALFKFEEQGVGEWVQIWRFLTGCQKHSGSSSCWGDWWCHFTSERNISPKRGKVIMFNLKSYESYSTAGSIGNNIVFFPLFI